MSQDDIFKDPTGENTSGGAGGRGSSGGGSRGAASMGGVSAGAGGAGGYSAGGGATGSSTNFGGSSGGQSGASFGGAGDAASQAYDSAKQGARSLGDQARERLMSYAEENKERLATQLDEFVQVIRRAGETMQEGDQPLPVAKYVSQAADQLDHFSTTIRESSTQDLLRRVKRFGNRNGTAIFGGALLAGIALGRFAIASGQNRNARRSSGYTGSEQFGAGRYPVPARTGAGTSDRYRRENVTTGGSEPMTPSEGMGTL